MSITRQLGPILAAVLTWVAPLDAQSPDADWPYYGRDAGGARYSPAARLTRENVSRLEIAWTWHSGEPPLDPQHGNAPRLEATPLVIDGLMYVITPRGLVAALDPANGQERWRYDTRVNPEGGYGDFTSRGVSAWMDPAAPTAAACRRRIFAATVDARLVALDALTGRPCADFGIQGTVDLRKGLRVPPVEFPAYEVTSPPAVVRGLVITGSAIADNSTLAPASGEVRAYDARTGALRWTWEAVPQDPHDPAYASWRDGSASRTGAANVWSVIAADSARNLIFLPTSSPAPDYFGGRRLGENRYANSVVALRASTGEMVWHFQTVHHDLWDYDNASPPALATITRDGKRVPVLLQATKTGQLFVLHRDTGEPLFPVEERPVPQSTVPGEAAWPTQPFTPTNPLGSHGFTAEDAWGPTPEARSACLNIMKGLRNEGVFTPPSLEGTLVVPSNIGGVHWGGVAIDERRGIAVVPVNRIAALVQLIPAEGFDEDSAETASDLAGEDFEYTRMRGTPYVMRRRFLLGPTGLPCTPPPFGSLVGVNITTNTQRWNVPLGGFPAREGVPPPPAAWGSPNLGGPIVTATGLVFIAATLDRAIRAFDIETGRELWRGALPAGGRATPITYEVSGRQFVVIAAGGGDAFGAGDALVAFALPQQ